MLFGKKKSQDREAKEGRQDTRQSFAGGAENPFLKPGDIIRLKSRDGKFQVASTDHEGFTVINYPTKRGSSKPIRCQWEDFRHWSRQ
ncbi:hypothetical protein SAMN05192529_1387 [Arachidicoccus rhizosphaerae]|uniref:Uncharacterized protein n=1 Tax=Arachidicoccus rhizosphaerae TaxID=551991 RepID=A0A1H4CWI6_9BACT|nr:hypothetical protein [Arachidicoccus rhizosphaerae]SEA64596.1 hypothetical protein SAMN05192529_1387 [Arachidicoccus rhizosphaerae]